MDFLRMIVNLILTLILSGLFISFYYFSKPFIPIFQGEIDNSKRLVYSIATILISFTIVKNNKILAILLSVILLILSIYYFFKYSRINSLHNSIRGAKRKGYIYNADKVRKDYTEDDFFITRFGDTSYFVDNETYKDDNGRIIYHIDEFEDMLVKLKELESDNVIDFTGYEEYRGEHRGNFFLSSKENQEGFDMIPFEEDNIYIDPLYGEERYFVDNDFIITDSGRIVYLIDLYETTLGNNN